VYRLHPYFLTGKRKKEKGLVITCITSKFLFSRVLFVSSHLNNSANIPSEVLLSCPSATLTLSSEVETNLQMEDTVQSELWRVSILVISFYAV